jgi:hypothetical protein
MMNWNGFGRKRPWPNFKVLSRHSPGGLRKATKDVSQDCRSADQDLIHRSPEYEAEILTTRPRRSVLLLIALRSAKLIIIDGNLLELYDTADLYPIKNVINFLLQRGLRITLYFSFKNCIDL